MPDITYTPYYPAGWRDLPIQTTAIIADALDTIDAGIEAVTAQANLALTTARSVTTDAVLYTSQALTSPQIAQALLNIKAMPTLRPEQFGALADGVTDDSLAFYACIQAGVTQATGAGCYIELQQGAKYYLGQAAHTAHSLQGLVDLQTGVYMGVPGGSGRGATGATYLIGDHTFTGYIVDTVNTGVQGCGLNGIIVNSDMSSPTSNAVGAIRFQGVAWGHFINGGVGNVSDVGLCILACVDMHLENLGISHNVTGRTLTDVTPAFFVSGTDHVLINIQANGGNTNATIGTLSSTNLYNAAIQLHSCDAIKTYGVNGEFADVGWYLGGTSSVTGGVASLHVTVNEFVDSRADYNAGHGYYFVSAAWNQFAACFVNNNSNNANGVYDGIYLSNSPVVLGNRFATIMGNSPTGAANIMGYYFHDAATGGVTQLDANMVGTIGGKRQGMAYDYALTALPYRLAITRGEGAGHYQFRTPSRYVSGSTWTDLSTPTVPTLTYSDGGGATSGTGGAIIGNGGWRLVSSNALTGNLLHAITSECVGGVSTGWLAITSTLVTTSPPVSTATATFAAVPFNTVTGTNPAIIQKLGNNQLLQVACNAAGVTAGAMQVLTPAVITGIAASTSYAAIVMTAAGTVARNVSFIIDCFSGATFLSSITTDAGATNSITAVTTHAFTFTTPASTNALQVRVVFTGAALHEQHYIGLMSVDTHSTQTIPAYS